MTQDRHTPKISDSIYPILALTYAFVWPPAKPIINIPNNHIDYSDNKTNKKH